MPFEPIGLGRKRGRGQSTASSRSVYGRGILDKIKSGVRKVQSWKLAQKGLDAIQNNKVIRDVLQKTGTLRPVTQALVKGRELGFGRMRRGQRDLQSGAKLSASSRLRGRGFFGDVYKGIKSGVSKISDVSSGLKKLGLARKAKSILPYAQKAAMFVPKYGAAISGGLEAASKPINWLADKGYGKKKKTFQLMAKRGDQVGYGLSKL